MSHRVARRTGEIGLRLALGASPRNVRQMMLRESVAVGALGVAAGAAAAYASGRFVAARLFGLSPSDPATYISASAMAIAMAILASLLPAWRASRIAPGIALKAR